MLAPPGAVEPGLSPAALAAAAVWTTRETGSVATLEALCPGGAFIPSPGPPGLVSPAVLASNGGTPR